jgi:hypothetical protein
MTAGKGGSRKRSPRKTGVETSAKIASLASRALKTPSKMTAAEVRKIAGAALANRQGPTVPVKRRSTKKR